MANNEFFRSVLDEAERCDVLGLAILSHPDCPVWVAEEIITKHQDWDAYDCAIGFKGVSYDILLREAGTNQSANEACVDVGSVEVLEKIIRGDAVVSSRAIERIVTNPEYKNISAEAANLLVSLLGKDPNPVKAQALCKMLEHDGLNKESLESIIGYTENIYYSQGLGTVMNHLVNECDLRVGARVVVAIDAIDRNQRLLGSLYRDLAHKLIQMGEEQL